MQELAENDAPTSEHVAVEEIDEILDEIHSILDENAHDFVRAYIQKGGEAARMGTSEAAIARLEAGEVDPRLSTVERFADALGKRLEWHLGESLLPPKRR
jgi:ubiquitin-like protein Pup